MKKVIKPSGYWTKERCQQVAIKYNSRGEMKKNDESCYTKSLKSGWMDDICSHMIKKIEYTKEFCEKIASKYNKKIDFYNYDHNIYRVSKNKEWLDDICNHMEEYGNLYKRCVYVFEFDDNFSYVGITYNIKNRESQHNSVGPVFNHIQKTKKYKLIQITDYIDIKDAQKIEEDKINEYEKNGWCLLNTNRKSTKGGSEQYWTKEKCLVESLKYKYKSDFQKNCRGAYGSSIKNGWYDEITSHMTTKFKNLWTDDQVNFLKDNINEKINFLVEKLNRSKKSIHYKKHTLKHKKNNKK